MTTPSDELMRARELALSLLRGAVTSDNGSHSVNMTVAVPLLLAALQSTAEKARSEERERCAGIAKYYEFAHDDMRHPINVGGFRRAKAIAAAIIMVEKETQK